MKRHSVKLVFVVLLLNFMLLANYVVAGGGVSSGPSSVGSARTGQMYVPVNIPRQGGC